MAIVTVAAPAGEAAKLVEVPAVGGPGLVPLTLLPAAAGVVVVRRGLA